MSAAASNRREESPVHTNSSLSHQQFVKGYPGMKRNHRIRALIHNIQANFAAWEGSKSVAAKNPYRAPP